MCLQFVQLYVLLFMGFLVVELLFYFYHLCPCCFTRIDILVSDLNFLSYSLDVGKNGG